MRGQTLPQCSTEHSPTRGVKFQSRTLMESQCAGKPKAALHEQGAASSRPAGLVDSMCSQSELQELFCGC